ncbi:hypothetical protein ACWKTS_22415 [Bacillus toyonensis]
MKHARGKQLALYVCKGNNTRYKEFKEIRGCIGNLTIQENVTSTSYCEQLDPTFKWHRDFHGMNIVSFNRKGESFKTYVIKGRK